jgi:predicted RNase H-like nuclease (RuvC/YqgF family)
MKYLLTYSAEVDGGNGTYNEDFKELYDKIEDIYEEIAHLESKEGKDFSFQIFELHEFDSSSIKTNEIYLKTKKDIEHRESVDKLKNQILNKKCSIYDLKSTMNKYGKWEKFEEQLATIESELSILENQLTDKLKQK